jgi:acetyltransferase-like isoleucine patch superfamily enzyme/dTDP-4-dehydrorhamnose 3,5-epimerase-like enzyme
MKARMEPEQLATVTPDRPVEPFIHPRALVETTRLGRGTRIWAFAHVLPGATIGDDCNICDGVFIENEVVVGDRVTVKCGVQLWDGITLEDDVFIGPNATFTNDPFPRNRQTFELTRTVVRRGASIGANATILPGLVIGQHAFVGAGSVVTRDVPAYAVVVGNPARIIRFAGADRLPQLPTTETDATLPKLRVSGVVLQRLPIFLDARGSLTFGEVGQHFPFPVARYFVVSDVPSLKVRGEHAHRECHEFLVCLRGSCVITLDDGHQREEVVLDSKTLGLFVPPMVWSALYNYTPDAILLVLNSHTYSAADYIRDYDEFRRLVVP